MKIHEYQAKDILRQFGVPVPRGIAAFTVQEAVEAAQKLGGSVWVVKAQIHAGGRGKGGGVKLARSIDDVKKIAAEILGMQLITHQTGPLGQKVRRLLIEEGAAIVKEYYVAALTDRATQRVALMASSEGGIWPPRRTRPFGPPRDWMGPRIALSGGASKYPASRCARRSRGQGVSCVMAKAVAAAMRSGSNPASAGVVCGQGCPLGGGNTIMMP